MRAGGDPGTLRCAAGSGSGDCAGLRLRRARVRLRRPQRRVTPRCGGSGSGDCTVTPARSRQRHERARVAEQLVRLAAGDRAGQAGLGGGPLAGPGREERGPLAQRRLHPGKQLPHALRRRPARRARLGPGRDDRGGGPQRGQVSADVPPPADTSLSAVTRPWRADSRSASADRRDPAPHPVRANLRDRVHGDVLQIRGRAGRGASPRHARLLPASPDAGAPGASTLIFEHKFGWLSIPLLLRSNVSKGSDRPPSSPLRATERGGYAARGAGRAARPTSTADTAWANWRRAPLSTSCDEPAEGAPAGRYDSCCAIGLRRRSGADAALLLRGRVSRCGGRRVRRTQAPAAGPGRRDAGRGRPVAGCSASATASAGSRASGGMTRSVGAGRIASARPGRDWLSDCLEVAEVHVLRRPAAAGTGTRR